MDNVYLRGTAEQSESVFSEYVDDMNINMGFIYQATSPFQINFYRRFIFPTSPPAGQNFQVVYRTVEERGISIIPAPLDAPPTGYTLTVTLPASRFGEVNCSVGGADTNFETILEAKLS